MPEQLQKVLNRIVEWWKKFNNKQRALMISITAVVILTLIILGYVVSRPDMVVVYTAETMTEASEVNDLLASSGIEYETSNGGMTFQVDSKDEAEACYALASGNIASTTYSITNVTSGGFSTTESDRQKLYVDFLEKKFQDHLTSFSFCKSATVDITLPDNTGTILSSQQQGTAAVKLELTTDIDEEQAYGLALFIATEIGNDGTEGVTILDQNSNLIYSADSSSSLGGTVSGQVSNTQKQIELVESKVEGYLKASPLFSNVQVAAALKISFDQETEERLEYYGNDDGSNTNMIDTITDYTAESNGGESAIPGTDSNDDTTYYIDSDGNVYYTVSDTETKYLTNQKIIKIIKDGAQVDWDESTVSVVATRNVIYNEEQLEAAGELDDMTFDEFKAAHSEPVKAEVDEQIIRGVANAAGISVDNVEFICYDTPIFEAKEAKSFSYSTLLQILLAVLIFGLLGYVVFRSTRRHEELEPEPEISIETLLEATAENEDDSLADIGYSEKSETRILIEKFVDENPDAVAVLLRNWLKEDWE